MYIVLPKILGFFPLLRCLWRLYYLSTSPPEIIDTGVGDIYPLWGLTTMALGLTSCFSNSLFLEVPLSLETSIQSISESVQYMLRDTQSMERPSGDFNPKHSI